MAKGEAQATGYVVPNPQAAKTIGILNVLFASILLACGLISAASMAAMPLVNRMMQAEQAKLKARVDAKNKADLDALAKQEKQATTEEQKQAIADERAEIAARPRTISLNFSMDPSAMGMYDPKFLGFWYADLATAIVLNVVMLSSGVGLLMLRPWSRKAWLWGAGIKLVRLVLVWGFFAIVVVPAFAPKLGKAVYQMTSVQLQAMGKPPGQAGMSEKFFTQLYGITYTGMAVGMVLFGSIYPAISLWVLTRPRVRAALLPEAARRPRPGPEVEPA